MELIPGADPVKVSSALAVLSLDCLHPYWSDFGISAIDSPEMFTTLRHFVQRAVLPDDRPSGIETGVAELLAGIGAAASGAMSTWLRLMCPSGRDEIFPWALVFSRMYASSRFKALDHVSADVRTKLISLTSLISERQQVVADAVKAASSAWDSALIDFFTQNAVQHDLPHPEQVVTNSARDFVRKHYTIEVLEVAARNLPTIEAFFREAADIGSEIGIHVLNNPL